MNMRSWILPGWLLLTAISGVEIFAQPLATVIENETLKVQRISPGGQWSLIRKSSQQVFARSAISGETGVATAQPFTHTSFGAGQTIEVSYSSGAKDRVALFPKLPFALFTSTLHNGSKETALTKEKKVLSVTLDLDQPAHLLKTFGTGGLTSPGENPGSYAWLAAVEPETRNGVVFGWLTHDRGSGVLFSRTNGNGIQIDAVVQYGNLRTPPGVSQELETLAVGYFEDARLGLESWADAVAKVYDIHLKSQPAGYCTWYSQPHGGASDQEHLLELAAFAVTNLAPFGFSVVQIDDGWQAGFKRSKPSSPKKDFRTHNPRGPYPQGMKGAADSLKTLGLVPGIWFMPFSGTIGDPFFDQHEDWFVKTAEGQPYDTPWGGASLDMTHPGAREHLRQVVRRICRDWGYQYIKIDGLWTGTATKQLYVNSGYKQDDLGQAVFNDPDKTPIEAFRSGLKLVRDAAGENVFILGCNGPQNMRSYGGAFGLVDAMRVGPDNGANLPGLLRGPTFGTRHYFLHRRVWLNDPDPVYVRASMPLEHARLICSWVALSGQLNLSSEWLPGLPAERLDILKRTMPTHNGVARPVDLFKRDLPQLWTLRARGRDVVGIFNWEKMPAALEVPLQELGLADATEYAGFDYWGNAFIPSIRGRLKVKVPAESCLILALRAKASHPYVVSTSRHVLQGIVDLLEEQWDPATKVLKGSSRLVGGDAYELRIDCGTLALKGVEIASEEKAGGGTASFAIEGALARVKIPASVSGAVRWTAKF